MNFGRHISIQIYTLTHCNSPSPTIRYRLRSLNNINNCKTTRPMTKCTSGGHSIALKKRLNRFLDIVKIQKTKHQIQCIHPTISNNCGQVKKKNNFVQNSKWKVGLILTVFGVVLFSVCFGNNAIRCVHSIQIFSVLVDWLDSFGCWLFAALIWFLGYSPYEPGYDYGMSYDGGGGGASSGHSSSSGKEMTLKKVYELALTAIAYLAFGIFVLQVIMCITTVCASKQSAIEKKFDFSLCLH